MKLPVILLVFVDAFGFFWNRVFPVWVVADKNDSHRLLEKRISHGCKATSAAELSTIHTRNRWSLKEKPIVRNQTRQLMPVMARAIR